VPVPLTSALGWSLKTDVSKNRLVGQQFDMCLSQQHQTDTAITTNIATPRAKPRDRRPARLSIPRTKLTSVGKSKLDKSRGRHSSTGRGKRHPRYDSIALLSYYRSRESSCWASFTASPAACILHSCSRPTEQTLARSAERARGLMGNETVLELESGGILLERSRCVTAIVRGL
jgi:hypothetical protein